MGFLSQLSQIPAVQLPCQIQRKTGICAYVTSARCAGEMLDFRDCVCLCVSVLLRQFS